MPGTERACPIIPLALTSLGMGLLIPSSTPFQCLGERENLAALEAFRIRVVVGHSKFFLKKPSYGYLLASQSNG
jgi:hypothetical protein